MARSQATVDWIEPCELTQIKVEGRLVDQTGLVQLLARP